MTDRRLVKICGLTTVESALAAADEGADMIGVVFAPGSSRQVSVATAASIVGEVKKQYPGVRCIGVFADADPEAVIQVRNTTGLDFVQLHGSEPPVVMRLLGPDVIRALRVSGTVPPHDGWEDAAWILYDTRSSRAAGGTGESFDWRLLEGRSSSAQPFLLAGGLTPDNVARAIEVARPDGVDVSSGVESAPGRKDRALIRRFIREVSRS